MLAAALFGLLVAMLLALVRSLLGPTVYDRILALNLFGTKTVLFIALIGFFMARPAWMDIALAYALINFISTIAVLKFMQHGGLGRTNRPHEWDDI